MGKVIELCRQCGFDIPRDAEHCPWCRAADDPCLAARQVAGLALRTRSVHPLSAIRSRREDPEPTLGPADSARSVFGYTWLFVVIALVGAALSWTARLDRFELTLPDGTADRIDTLAELAAWASVVGLVVGLVAMVEWSIRRLVATRTLRRDHHVLL